MSLDRICGWRKSLDGVALGAIVGVCCFELSVVIVFVTIRAMSVRYEISGRKLAAQRGFVALFALDSGVFAFEPVVCK